MRPVRGHAGICGHTGWIYSGRGWGQDKLRMDEPAKMTDSIHIMLKMAILISMIRLI